MFSALNLRVLSSQSEGEIRLKKRKKEKTLIKSIPFPAFVITAESYCKYGVSTNKDLEYMSRALEIRLSLRGWNYKASVM